MDILGEINWISLGQIILIDILLGGDNAIVIAMACRQLPQELRRQGLIWGAFGAIAARIILLFVASAVLQWAWIKLCGAVLLYWIAFKMLRNDTDEPSITAHNRLFFAICSVVIADLVMSLDNVVAVASAAHLSGTQNPVLLMALGVLISIPFVLFGSGLFLRLLDRFAWLINLGAAMLAYIAGSMLLEFVALVAPMQQDFLQLNIIIPSINVKLSVLGLAGIFALFLLHFIDCRRSENSKP